MGHCVESGYALIDADRVVLLDEAATPQVIERASASSRQRGLRLRAVREQKSGEMHTVHVEEVT